ncbi:MAG: DUF433 domain-containing protein [bacterium]
MRRATAARKRAAAPPLSVRLEPSLVRALRDRARRAGQPISRVIRDLLDESLRMQRHPGITFVEGPAGRRAHLPGTGFDIWEVIELLREYGSAGALREHFPRLSLIAIHVAEAYAREYREEIDAFLKANAEAPEDLRRKVPWLEVVRA